MRGLLVLVFALVGLIVVVQNRQPVALLIGGNTPETAWLRTQLPLGLWLILAATTGFLGYFAIAVLSQLGTPKPSSPRRPSRPPQASSRRDLPPDPEPPTPRYTPPSTSEPDGKVDSMSKDWDWDDPIPEVADWDEPAPEPVAPPTSSENRIPRPQTPQTPPQPSVPSPSQSTNSPVQNPTTTPSSEPEQTPPSWVDESPTEPETDSVPLHDDPPQSSNAPEPLPDLRQFELPQRPTQTQRQGTIYSQTYRPAKPKPTTPSPTPQKTLNASPRPVRKSGQPKDIVDADYRVIVPPHYFA